MKNETKYNLPIGYFDFHQKQLYNFQFNRWYSLGFARFEDMVDAGKKVSNFSDWKHVSLNLAENAEAEGRLKNAAIYYRGTEFYITQKDPDKFRCYDKFIELFYEIIKEDHVERFKIPYQKSFLHAFKVPVFDGKKKGTILMHGGFDSFVEEFYFMMRLFADNGYEVIAYEGPGQGGTRRKYDLSWDEKWERPTQAVLDFFKLRNVTIYGLSMGGHLCLRAAACEPRIHRVISAGGAFDYQKIPDPLSRYLMNVFFRHKNFMTNALVKKMKKDEHHNWVVENAKFITKIDQPFDAMMKMFQMNESNSKPENITQDVLILTGKKDHFIPMKMHNLLIRKLTHANSVTGIIYTTDTYAQNHCQIGNIPLVCNDIINWLEKV